MSKQVQAQKFTLSGSGVSASATSIALVTLTTPDGTAITMTDFGSDVGYATLEPGTAREESISFTGITGTTLTGVSRGLRFVSPFDVVSANKKAHAGGTVLVFSNTSAFYSRFVDDFNAQTIGGVKTFTSIPVLPASNPTTDNQAARKAYVDTKISLTGNETIAGVKTFTSTDIAKYNAHPTFTLDEQIIDKKYADDLAIAGAPDASTTTKGIVKLSSAPASPTSPVALNSEEVSTTAAADKVPRALGSGLLDNSWVPSYNADTDQVQATTDGASTVGEANATTKHNLLAQSFVPTYSSIRGVRMWKTADTGTFTGTVKISLQADSAGSPSGSDLASLTITNAAWLKLTAAAEFGLEFSTQYTSLTVGGTYWIVVTCSTSDNSNHPNLGINSAGGYASGVAKYKNVTDGWVTLTGQDLYFKTLQGTQSKLVSTGSSDSLINQYARPYSYIDINNTTVSASNTSVGTTVTTTMYSKQLEGGQISANSGLKFKILATATSTTWDNNSNSINYLELRYNGTALLRIYARSQSEGTLAAAMLSFEGTIMNQGSLSSQSSKCFALFGTTFHQASNTSAVDFSQPGKLELVSVLASIGSVSINISNAFYGIVLEKIS